MKGHQFEICRALYQVQRENGSPAVHVTKLSKDFTVAETSDGKILRHVMNACCRWSAKAMVAGEWLETFKGAGK